MDMHNFLDIFLFHQHRFILFYVGHLSRLFTHNNTEQHIAAASKQTAMACAPVYREPEEVRRAALEALDAFESLDPRMWVDCDYMPPKRDGSLHYNMRDKQSWKVRGLKLGLAGFNLLGPSRLKISSEEMRLGLARRGVLLSVLMHTQLWMRGNVLNERGEPVASEDKKVLSPDSIFDFFNEVRATNGRYDFEKVRDLLEKMPVVAIPRDTSHWSEVGLPVVFRLWDMRHAANGDLWCTCNLRKEMLK
jgi:hypothetical protein